MSYSVIGWQKSVQVCMYPVVSLHLLLRSVGALGGIQQDLDFRDKEAVSILKFCFFYGVGE